MSEAPKTIYLSNDIPRLLFFEGEVGFVEYIRKDVYDKHCIIDIDRYDKVSLFMENNAKEKVIQQNAKDIQFLKYALNKSQAHIKKLEEILKNALRCGWHSMEGSIDGTFDDLTGQEIRQFRKDAKSALAKESTKNRIQELEKKTNE
jgi:hypothetical protein